MSRYASSILGVLVFVLVMQVVVLAPQNVNERRKSLGSLPNAPSADIEQAMRGVHLVETSEGAREWELWADEAVAFKNRNVWELKQVKVVLFAENGVEFTVTGDRGEIETQTKNLQIAGSVVTKSSNGYLFKTETVNYSSEQRRLLSPGAVEMTGPKDLKGHRLALKGEGLDADLKSSLINIKSGVRAERQLPPDRTVVIRSDGARFSGKERLAKFLGNVIMDMDDMRITGPEAEFEYDANKEIVKSIAVKGGVKVSDSEKWATSQNLKVHFEEDKYIFRGNPRVVQDSDELRGEEIVFLDGGRKVLVQRARARVDERSLEKVNN
ncbi:MAG: LPS export ABC transporter periplasmic protein LptC [Bdellovibrionales bacterium]